jgi:hypothetical protein
MSITTRVVLTFATLAAVYPILMTGLIRSIELAVLIVLELVAVWAIWRTTG